MKSEDFYDYFNLRNPKEIFDDRRNSNEFRDIGKKEKQEIEKIEETKEEENKEIEKKEQ